MRVPRPWALGTDKVLAADLTSGHPVPSCLACRLALGLARPGKDPGSAGGATAQTAPHQLASGSGLVA